MEILRCFPHTLNFFSKRMSVFSFTLQLLYSDGKNTWYPTIWCSDALSVTCCWKGFGLNWMVMTSVLGDSVVSGGGLITNALTLQQHLMRHAQRRLDSFDDERNLFPWLVMEIFFLCVSSTVLLNAETESGTQQVSDGYWGLLLWLWSDLV